MKCEKSTYFPGFTLVEVLCVLTTTMLLSGALLFTAYVSIWGQEASEARTKREAQTITRWLNRVYIKALLERRVFEIYFSSSQATDKLILKWMDTNTQEIYDAKGRCYMLCQSAIWKASYTPTWHMTSPGFTLACYHRPTSNNLQKAVCFIRVSPYCRVLVTKDAP